MSHPEPTEADGDRQAQDGDDLFAGRKRSQLVMGWRSFRHHRLAVAGLVFILLMSVVSLLTYIDEVVFEYALIESILHNPHDPVGTPRESPSATHPMGTDDIGRDILARTIFATKISLQVALGAILTATAIGSTMGIVAGYFGGRIEMLVMRFVDMLLGFPALVLAIGVVATLGFELRNVIIALAIVYTPQFARIARSSAISVKEEEYIDAANALGYSRRHILFREVLPNCISPLLVQASLLMALAIIAEAALSFLGLGVQPPTPSWGEMVARGTTYLSDAPWISLFPGIAIFIAVLSFNLVGDGIRDVFDPHDDSERRF